MKLPCLSPPGRRRGRCDSLLLMLSDFWSWCWAVLNHWQVLVTGGAVTAIISVIQARRGKGFPWSVTRWILFLFLITAFFLTWRDQYTRARPRVDIKIIRGGVAENSVDTSGGSFIYLELLLSNSGQRTGLIPWVVSVQDGAKWIRANTAVINGGPVTMNGKGGSQTLPGRDKFIPEVTMHALGEGDIVSGYLTARFLQPISFFKSRPAWRVEVSCRDVFGNEWKAETTLNTAAALDMTTTTPGVR